jgi:hypothetical protein
VTEYEAALNYCNQRSFVDTVHIQRSPDYACKSGIIERSSVVAVVEMEVVYFEALVYCGSLKIRTVY